MKTIAIIAFLGLACTLAAQPAGKVAPKPLFRDPIHDGAADPVIVWNRAEKKWFMIYTNRRANIKDATGVAWVHGTRLGIAESSDEGATWTYKGTAQIDYGGADYSHWAPDIIDDGKTYHMYLSIVPGTLTDWNHPREIVHLTSNDLVKWTYRSKLDLGSDRVIDATVFQVGLRKWRLWFKDEREKSHIHYADSTNLYDWTRAGAAVTDRGCEGAKVFRWKGRYWMVTDMWKGLAVFTSEDAVAWTAQKDPILHEPGVTRTDREKGQHPDVVVNGDRAFIFYFVHQKGLDADANDPTYERRTVLQVAELEFKDGQLVCDRNKPAHIQLKPPAAQ